MTAPAAGLFVKEIAAHQATPLGVTARVVLVHGSMDRHRSFLRLAHRLSEYDVVLYDRRGYSESRHVAPPARGVGDHAADLIHILAGVPSIVVGHSYGGTLALAVAQARPDLVRAAVVYEPPLAWMPMWQPQPGQPRMSAVFEGVDPGDAAEAFVSRMIGDQRYQRLSPSTRQHLRADGPALVREMTSIRTDPPPFEPSSIGIPLVVARGSLAAQRHVQAADWLVSQLPEGELHVVDGAAHAGPVSHPEEVAALVRRAVELSRARSGR